MMLSFSEMQMIENARDSIDDMLMRDYYGDDAKEDDEESFE